VANVVALSVATLILVMIPGPNAALIVANSLRYGPRMGVVTVLGTTLGVALQLAVVLLGMAALLELTVQALVWIRWLGVLYLLWLGIRTWRRPDTGPGAVTAAPVVLWRASLVASVNPKTLLFNAAFLPQFVVPGDDANAQLLTLAMVFLSVLLLGDLLWVALARAVQRLVLRQSSLHRKITGSALVLAGIGLALSHRA